jgi:hypothetical protein
MLSGGSVVVCGARWWRCIAVVWRWCGGGVVVGLRGSGSSGGDDIGGSVVVMCEVW